MAYNTNYRIIDKKSKEVVFKSTSTACFSEMNYQIAIKDPPTAFVAGRLMEVFVHEDVISPRLDAVKLFIEDLNTLGISINMSTVTIARDDENYPKRLHNLVNTKSSDVFYQFDLDFDKYNSKAHLKFGYYTLRYVYENTMPQVVDEYSVLKSANPDTCSWELFQLACMIKSSGAMSGHYLISAYTIANISSLKELNKCIAKWEGKPLNQGEMNQVSSLNYFRAMPGVNTVPGTHNEITSGMKLDDYKQLLEKIKYVREDVATEE